MEKPTIPAVATIDLWRLQRIVDGYRDSINYLDEAKARYPDDAGIARQLSETQQAMRKPLVTLEAMEREVGL